MHKKTLSLVAMLATITGLAFIPSAAVAKTVSPRSSYCEYNQYNQCCTYGEYGQYCQYTEPGGGNNGNGSSPTQTVSGGNATPDAVTVNTTYPNASTLVNINLPAGTLARKFYMYTVLGVSFGVDHSYKVLKKDILVYNGSKNVKYNITKLSRPHGRVHLYLAQNLAAPTFKVSKNVFEFTPRERAVIKKFNIKKTLVSIQVTTTTGKVYTVHFKALFGALVVVKFH